MADRHRLQWGDLIVEAHRIGDRFDWRITCGSQPTQTLTLLHSTPSDKETAWPPFPPVQELAQESHADTEVLLGVGMAGKSHWSVSVDCRQEPDRPAMFFDFACRLSAIPTYLGASWILGDGLNAMAPTSNDKPFLLREKETIIATLTPNNHSSLRLLGNQLLVIPEQDKGVFQGTIRWGFQIARTESSHS